MASVLAIVSKALFEKMLPKKELELGAVVDTDEYVSKNPAFNGLEDGGAIFLVTVRPPNEALWLVGILESPKKKGADKWTASENVAPLTDVTSAIKKLKFQSGSGIQAKKGALGMSLQTPRVLTAADETLLRGFVSTKPASSKKIHANDAYKAAVDKVVHAPKKSKLGGLRLDNHRKPFEGKIGDLDKSAREQLQAILGKGVKLESMFGKVDDGNEEGSEMAAIEIADVLDVESGAVKFQLFIWPYGDGAVVHHKTTKMAASICQHGFDPHESMGKLFVQDFAKAWAEGSKRLKMWTGHIDFSDDEMGED